MRGFVVAFATCLFCIPAIAQSGGKAEVFPAAQTHAQSEELIAKAKSAGSSGETLADYGSHKLQISVRTANGNAEIHAHYDDVFIIEQGTATLVTGGSVVDASTNQDGETKGSGIQGGKSQTVSVGDIITVNAGIPHQFLIPAGTVYRAIVIKVKE